MGYGNRFTGEIRIDPPLAWADSASAVDVLRAALAHDWTATSPESRDAYERDWAQAFVARCQDVFANSDGTTEELMALLEDVYVEGEAEDTYGALYNVSRSPEETGLVADLLAWRDTAVRKALAETEHETDGEYAVHTPLVVTTDVWPSHADSEDPSTPILGWVMETSLNGYSVSFDTQDDEPTEQDIERVQRGVFVALRDAVCTPNGLQNPDGTRK